MLPGRESEALGQPHSNASHVQRDKVQDRAEKGERFSHCAGSQ